MESFAGHLPLYVKKSRHLKHFSGICHLDKGLFTHSQTNVLLQLIHLFVHLSVARVCLETAFDKENNCYLTCPDIYVHIPDFTIRGMQGWHSGESTGTPPPPPPPLCPGSISRSGVICALSLLVLGSAPSGFLRVFRFPLSSKTSI